MKKLFLSGLSLLCFIVVFWWLHIEFLDVRFNYLAKLGFYFSFTIIFLPIIFIKKPSSLWGRGPIIFLAALCFWISLIPLACEVANAKGIFKSKINSSYMKLHEIKVGNKYYTCFRSDGGATTDYGIDIRKESRYFFLVKYELISSLYHAYDAQFYEANNKWFVKITNRAELIELK